MAVASSLDRSPGYVGLVPADPTRRRVLVHLIDRVGYPAEMAQEIGTTRANLSNHLTCLREVRTGDRYRRRPTLFRYELSDSVWAKDCASLPPSILPGPAL